MNKYQIDLPEDSGLGEPAKWLLWIGLITTFVLAFCVDVYAAPTYRITDLGDLRGGRDQSFAVDINNAGWIVGEASTARGPRAAVWKRKRNGAYKLINLGATRDHNSSLANSINADNTVVGRSSVIGELELTSVGVRWIRAKNGKYIARELGTQCLNWFGFDYTQAFSINDSGSIVGLDGDCSFIWERGKGMKILSQSQYGESEVLTDINNAGVAVGTSYGPVFGHPAPFVRDTVSNNAFSLLLTPEELDGNFFSVGYAEGINGRGYVVGQLGDHFLGCCDTVAVLWSPVNGKYTGTIISPPHSDVAFTTEARGLDINRHNQVVGAYSVQEGVDGTPAKEYAFYWHSAHGFLDLNKLVARKDPLRGKFKLLRAYAINDRGWIVGYGLTKGGKFHAFLLTKT